MFAGHCVRLARPISDRSVGSYSVAPDRWLWFHGAWFRQAVQGPRRIGRYPARASCACATFHGMDHYTDRAARRLSDTFGRLRVLGQFPMAALLLVAIFTVHLPY